tara:strand:+ start:518 stop:979 length:462 start_codon:yes stop_codon:yes gene_type:complete
MVKYLSVLLSFFAFACLQAQDTTRKSAIEGTIITPDGDVILPEITIETVDVKETSEWKTIYFYELTEKDGRYKLKDGTKQELTRIVELNGKNNTLRIYDKKGLLKMHHDVNDVIRSENQLILNFSNGSYMIIDSKNNTISLFKSNFGFVYKMK